MGIMAVGAVLGGLDRILGNRFGLGERFEEGFRLLGSIALSMVGILCLEPVLSSALRTGISPIYRALGLDPGMLGSLLAIDMGGFPLATGLANRPEVGRYAGIIAASIFGCTISFTIPVGMGTVQGEQRGDFAQGMLFGLVVMPAGLLLGACMSGLTLPEALWESLPLFILSAILLLMIRFRPEAALKGFSAFARFLEAVITVGLVLGAVRFMTGWSPVAGLLPIEDAMAVAASIAVVLLGSLPVAELLQRALRKPFTWLGERTGMNQAGVAGLLLTMVSVMPTLALFPQMDRRSRVVNAAASVSITSLLSAHLGFAAGVAPDMLAPMLLAKLLGGVLSVAVALWATRGMSVRKDDIYVNS